VKIKSDILGEFELPMNEISGNPTNENIEIGIRPERITINPSNSNSKDLIDGEIIDISYFGETTYYKLKCGEKSESLNVSTQNSFGQLDYKIGEIVKLKVDKNSMVGFYS
jgi:ABC-type Fe3+/spermidine/putrescine transport system ATPase subunit